MTNSKRPVITPGNVRGLVVRTPSELPIRVAMEALGAVVATVDFNDLQKALGVCFPVWVLITKCDRLVGFREFSLELPSECHNQLLGWTNDLLLVY